MSIKRVALSLFFILTLVYIKSYGVWNTATPAGSESKSLGDDRLRELKTDIQTTLQYEGDFPGSDTSNPRFIYTPSTGTTGNRPTGNAAPTGRLYINTSSTTLEMYNGASWQALDVVGSSTITSGKIDVNVAGNGLTGGGGYPFQVNVSTNFNIASDSVTIAAATIQSHHMASSVTVPTFGVSTLTWQTFGVMPILQVQSFTTTTSSASGTSSFQNSNLTVTITPKKTSSTIFVLAYTNMLPGGSVNNHFTIARNGTNLGSSNGLASIQSDDGGPMTLFYYDSPASTSAQTYTVQIYADTSFPSTIQYNSTRGIIMAVELGN